MRCEADLQRFILAQKSNYHIIQAESRLINPGIFDLNMAGSDGREHWMELKWKYSNEKPHIRMPQIRWAEKRLEFNDSLWMLVGSSTGVMIFHASRMAELKLTPWTSWKSQSVMGYDMNYFKMNMDQILGEAYGRI